MYGLSWRTHRRRLVCSRHFKPTRLAIAWIRRLPPSAQTRSQRSALWTTQAHPRIRYISTHRACHILTTRQALPASTLPHSRHKIWASARLVRRRPAVSRKMSHPKLSRRRVELAVVEHRVGCRWGFRSIVCVLDLLQ